MKFEVPFLHNLARSFIESGTQCLAVTEFPNIATNVEQTQQGPPPLRTEVIKLDSRSPVLINHILVVPDGAAVLNNVVVGHTQPLPIQCELECWASNLLHVCLCPQDNPEDQAERYLGGLVPSKLHLTSGSIANSAVLIPRVAKNVKSSQIVTLVNYLASRYRDSVFPPPGTPDQTSVFDEFPDLILTDEIIIKGRFHRLTLCIFGKIISLGRTPSPWVAIQDRFVAECEAFANLKGMDIPTTLGAESLSSEGLSQSLRKRLKERLITGPKFDRYEKYIFNDAETPLTKSDTGAITSVLELSRIVLRQMSTVPTVGSDRPIACTFAVQPSFEGVVWVAKMAEALSQQSARQAELGRSDFVLWDLHHQWIAMAVFHWALPLIDHLSQSSQIWNDRISSLAPTPKSLRAYWQMFTLPLRLAILDVLKAYCKDCVADHIERLVQHTELPKLLVLALLPQDWRSGVPSIVAGIQTRLVVLEILLCLLEDKSGFLNFLEIDDTVFGSEKEKGEVPKSAYGRFVALVRGKENLDDPIRSSRFLAPYVASILAISKVQWLVLIRLPSVLEATSSDIIPRVASSLRDLLTCLEDWCMRRSEQQSADDVKLQIAGISENVHSHQDVSIESKESSESGKMDETRTTMLKSRRRDNEEVNSTGGLTEFPLAKKLKTEESTKQQDETSLNHVVHNCIHFNSCLFCNDCGDVVGKYSRGQHTHAHDSDDPGNGIPKCTFPQPFKGHPVLDELLFEGDSSSSPKWHCTAQLPSYLNVKRPLGRILHKQVIEASVDILKTYPNDKSIAHQLIERLGIHFCLNDVYKGFFSFALPILREWNSVLVKLLAIGSISPRAFKLCTVATVALDFIESITLAPDSEDVTSLMEDFSEWLTLKSHNRAICFRILSETPTLFNRWISTTFQNPAVSLRKIAALFNILKNFVVDPSTSKEFLDMIDETELTSLMSNLTSRPDVQTWLERDAYSAKLAECLTSAFAQSGALSKHLSETDVVFSLNQALHSEAPLLCDSSAPLVLKALGIIPTFSLERCPATKMSTRLNYKGDTDADGSISLVAPPPVDAIEIDESGADLVKKAWLSPNLSNASEIDIEILFNVVNWNLCLSKLLDLRKSRQYEIKRHTSLQGPVRVTSSYISPAGLSATGYQDLKFLLFQDDFDSETTLASKDATTIAPPDTQIANVAPQVFVAAGLLLGGGDGTTEPILGTSMMEHRKIWGLSLILHMFQILRHTIFHQSECRRRIIHWHLARALVFCWSQCLATSSVPAGTAAIDQIESFFKSWETAGDAMTQQFLAKFVICGIAPDNATFHSIQARLSYILGKSIFRSLLGGDSSSAKITFYLSTGSSPPLLAPHHVALVGTRIFQTALAAVSMSGTPASLMAPHGAPVNTPGMSRLPSAAVATMGKSPLNLSVELYFGGLSAPPPSSVYLVANVLPDIWLGVDDTRVSSLTTVAGPNEALLETSSAVGVWSDYATVIEVALNENLGPKEAWIRKLCSIPIESLGTFISKFLLHTETADPTLLSDLINFAVVAHSYQFPILQLLPHKLEMLTLEIKSFVDLTPSLTTRLAKLTFIVCVLADRLSTAKEILNWTWLTLTLKEASSCLFKIGLEVLQPDPKNPTMRVFKETSPSIASPLFESLLKLLSLSSNLMTFCLNFIFHQTEHPTASLALAFEILTRVRLFIRPFAELANAIFAALGKVDAKGRAFAVPYAIQLIRFFTHLLNNDVTTLLLAFDVSERSLDVLCNGRYSIFTEKDKLAQEKPDAQDTTTTMSVSFCSCAEVNHILDLLLDIDQTDEVTRTIGDLLECVSLERPLYVPAEFYVALLLGRGIGSSPLDATPCDTTVRADNSTSVPAAVNNDNEMLDLYSDLLVEKIDQSSSSAVDNRVSPQEVSVKSRVQTFVTRLNKWFTSEQIQNVESALLAAFLTSPPTTFPPSLFTVRKPKFPDLRPFSPENWIKAFESLGFLELEETYSLFAPLRRSMNGSTLPPSRSECPYLWGVDPKERLVMPQIKKSVLLQDASVNPDDFIVWNRAGPGKDSVPTASSGSGYRQKKTVSSARAASNSLARRQQATPKGLPENSGGLLGQAPMMVSQQAQPGLMMMAPPPGGNEAPTMMPPPTFDGFQQQGGASGVPLETWGRYGQATPQAAPMMASPMHMGGGLPPHSGVVSRVDNTQQQSPFEQLLMFPEFKEFVSAGIQQQVPVIEIFQVGHLTIS